jgi:TldD protein
LDDGPVSYTEAAVNVHSHLNHIDMHRSRRDFVRLASTAAAASLVWPTKAITELDPRRPIRDGFGISDRSWFDPNDIAAKALEAARAAGASYADIRVDHKISQRIVIRGEFGGEVDYTDNVGFGVRVIADGQWGFVGSDASSVDAVIEAARRAVRQAQVNAKGRRTKLELLPVPAVSDGQWTAPIGTDPFSVSVGEQQEALRAGTLAALAVANVKRAVALVKFERLDRVYASTDGSHIVQTFFGAFPTGSVSATVAGDEVMAGAAPKGFQGRAAGYEVVPQAKLAETMRAAAFEAVAESKALLEAPPRSVDVGRYELVVAPQVFYGMVSGTILEALGMERALGKRAGEEGTSYASPPEKTLGVLKLGAPHLTVRGDRSAAGGLMTVGWDDEGVKPDEMTFVERGVVTDYLALRENAPKLASWYQQRGGAARAHGVAAVYDWSRPAEATPNVTIGSGTATGSVDDLIKDVTRGVYMYGFGGAGADFGLMNAYGYAQKVQEIRNGKLVGRLKDVAVQFQVQSFWKGLLGLGGPGTMETFTDGSPYLFMSRTVRAVPARFKEVNVVNTGRIQ